MRFIIFLCLLPSSVFSQIQIEKSENGWDVYVDSALKKIKSIDSNYYRRILDVCDHISFWHNDFSSSEGDSGKNGTILISIKDVRSGNIDNLCAILVYESAHLGIIKREIQFHHPDEEEAFCYRYELRFLRQIPRMKRKLIRHTESQIKKLSHH